MAQGEDAFLCPSGGAPLTLTGDTDLTSFFAGAPWKKGYVRRIRNSDPVYTVVLQLVRVNDGKVSPPTVGGTLEVLTPGQSIDGMFTAIIYLTSTPNAALSLQA